MSSRTVGGGFQVALGAAADLERIQEALLTGEGVGWHEHGHDVFEGCRRFFKSGYRANLLASWIPALDGMHAGCKQVDESPMSAAVTAPRRSSSPRGTRVRRWSVSTITPDSIAEASRRAEQAGLGGRLRFEVAAADGFRVTARYRPPDESGHPARVAGVGVIQECGVGSLGSA